MSAWLREASGLRLFVRLTPKAAMDRIDGVATLADGTEVLAIRVRAIPADGKANIALLRLLAAELDLPRSAIRVARGETARLKELAIAGDPVALLDMAERLWPDSPRRED